MTNSSLKSLLIMLLVGTGGILYGYDMGVISGALLFIRRSIPITANEIGILVGAVFAGGLFGTLIAGPIADSLGRRLAILIAGLIFIIGILAILVAHDFMMLLLARLALGVGVGFVAVVVPLYAAELAPRRLRGRFVTSFQLFLTFGILLAYVIDLLFTPSGNWRAMFAVILIPAILMCLGIMRLPESPRWLLANGFKKAAMASLCLTHSTEEAKVDFTQIEAGLQQTHPQWRALLGKKTIAALIVAVSISICNQLTGVNAILQYAPVILKQSGVHSNITSMFGSIGIGGFQFLFTLLALLFIDKLGRRKLLLTGLFGLTLSLFALALISTYPQAINQAKWTTIGLFSYIIFYAIGPGMVIWLAISELFPTKVRGKGMAVCLFFNSLSAALISTLFETFRTEWHLSVTYLFFAGSCVVYFLITYFYLPETASKNLEDVKVIMQKPCKRAAELIEATN